MLNHLYFFFFNDTATTEIYTLSLHDALPIFLERPDCGFERRRPGLAVDRDVLHGPHERPGEPVAEDPRLGHEPHQPERSEEHTSELQSRQYLVCRLLLEKKKKEATTEHDRSQ